MIDFLWNNFFKKKQNSISSFLQNQPLFSTLTPRELRVVERLIHRRSYFSGEVIFKPGSGIGLYMILKGKVHISYTGSDEKNPLVIGQLGEGDFFGELSLIQEKGYQKTTAKAVEASELLGFFKPEMTSLIEKSPKLGAKILTKLCEILGMRLKKAGEKLAGFQGES